MRLLIVIGAGASYDSWPENLFNSDADQKLPLANNLFEPLSTQNTFLQRYSLMGLASLLRSKLRSKGVSFDVEEELEILNDNALRRDDMNTFQDLFKTRFYLHGLIKNLSQKTISRTHGHTSYVDLLTQLKEWIYQSPDNIVDIVSFNYDDLIENAMQNVYNYDWKDKNRTVPLSAYYRGSNLHIYKPHGSVNWGRVVVHGIDNFLYNTTEQAFDAFNDIELLPSFQFIDPNVIDDERTIKSYIPAIAVPFKSKANFDECPSEMQYEMLNAVKQADKIITLGWKGGEEHFTRLLADNKKIDAVFVVSPNADTKLDNTFTKEKIIPLKYTFRHFVGDPTGLENLLLRL